MVGTTIRPLVLIGHLKCHPPPLLEPLLEGQGNGKGTVLDVQKHCTWARWIGMWKGWVVCYCTSASHQVITQWNPMSHTTLISNRLLHVPPSTETLNVDFGKCFHRWKLCGNNKSFWQIFLMRCEKLTVRMIVVNPARVGQVVRTQAVTQWALWQHQAHLKKKFCVNASLLSKF